jgi:hypothetical protein
MESKLKVKSKKKSTGVMKVLRDIRRQMSKDIYGLSYEEFVSYMEKSKIEAVAKRGCRG